MKSNKVHWNFSPMEMNKQLRISTNRSKDSSRSTADQQWNDSNSFWRSLEDLFYWRESSEWDDSMTTTTTNCSLLHKCSKWCFISVKNKLPNKEKWETTESSDWPIAIQELEHKDSKWHNRRRSPEKTFVQSEEEDNPFLVEMDRVYVSIEPSIDTFD